MSKARQRWQTALLGLVTPLWLMACGQQTPVKSVPVLPPKAELTGQALAGLTCMYFDNLDFTGPTHTRTDNFFSAPWGVASPAPGIQPTTYSIRWTGQIQSAYTEPYTFFIQSSGGARLMINGQLLINDWTEHALKTSSATINMVAGTKYDVRMEFFRDTP